MQRNLAISKHPLGFTTVLFKSRCSTQPTALRESKQAEVFDFVAFLANRNLGESGNDKTLADSPLAKFIRNPSRVNEFTPLSRDEANAH